MEKKIGVYIDTAYGIGDVLDIEALSKVATKEKKVPVCQASDALSTPEGRALIRKDIDEQGVNCVIVAGASPRVLGDLYDFPGCIVERVNLREGVVWCTEPNSDLDDENEDIQMMAEDYLRMAVVKVQKMNPPTPYLGPDGEATQFSKDILVVGGGVAGMSAALDAAKAGYKVTIAEKEAELGGWGAKWKKSSPTKAPYQDLEDTGAADLIASVTGHDNIQVLTSAEIKSIKGMPGLFDATCSANGSEVIHRFGAIIQATGWSPYKAEKLTDWGYGASPDVITNVQMEEMAKAGHIVRPSDGSAPDAVAFIQCAGSRDEKHLPYCSAVCCRASLKQAMYVKEQNPDAAVYILYRDIRTPGQDEEFYRQVQKAGVVFIRIPDKPESVTASGGKITVTAEDVILGEKVTIEDLDLLVLASGMKANAAHWLVEDVVVADEKAAEQEKDEPKQKVERSILNLTYRQGPDLPSLKYDMPDSHFICFPYESRRTGIYAAGCVRRPMTMSTAKEDASGAALKAIQAMTLAPQGMAVHPRTGDLSYPKINFQRCTQCRRCTDECPFGAYDEDEKTFPMPMPTRCRRCGVCMGACPERIISFDNYSVDMIGSMIKEVEIPEEDEEKPRILMLVCENDAYPALDMAGLNKMKYSPYVRVISLRCLGSLNLVWIADALSKGFDGVLLLGCRHGDDYQCHFIKGSELANIRMSKISETLTRLALEPERIRVEQVAISDWPRIPGIIEEFMETMEKVGPNPFKDL